MSRFLSKVTFLIGSLCLFVSLARANVPQTCYTCDGIGCLRTSVLKTKKCDDPLDYCITVFDEFNVLKRGCSMEIPDEMSRRCDKHNGIMCHKCIEDECNLEGREDDLCVICDSSKDSNCANDISKIKPTRCPAPSAPNAYCYVRVEGNVTKRGCAISVKDQRECFNSANCALCLVGDVPGCNRFNFKPGTSRAFFI